MIIHLCPKCQIEVPNTKVFCACNTMAINVPADLKDAVLKLYQDGGMVAVDQFLNAANEDKANKIRAEKENIQNEKDVDELIALIKECYLQYKDLLFKKVKERFISSWFSAVVFVVMWATNPSLPNFESHIYELLVMNTQSNQVHHLIGKKSFEYAVNNLQHENFYLFSFFGVDFESARQAGILKKDEIFIGVFGNFIRVTNLI